MEEEVFISGYCRKLDQSRMVTAIVAGGALEEADCCYGNCVYQPGCPIAQQIDELIQK